MGYVKANLPLNGSSTTWTYYAVDQYFYGFEPVVFNGDVYVFSFDLTGNGTIKYARSSNPSDRNSWIFHTFNSPDFETYKPLEATVYEGNLILTWIDPSTDDVRWATSTNGTSWSNRGITGYRSVESPAVMAYPNYDENYALSASITASSTFPGYGYSASNTKDGRTNTDQYGNESWSNSYPSRGGTLPQYVTLDFGTAKNFSTVQLYTSNGYALQDYQIQVSDNNIFWTTVATVTGNSLLRRISTFSNQSKRYLRVQCNKGPNHQPEYVRINELEVY